MDDFSKGLVIYVSQGRWWHHPWYWISESPSNLRWIKATSIRCLSRHRFASKISETASQHSRNSIKLNEWQKYKPHLYATTLCYHRRKNWLFEYYYRFISLGALLFGGQESLDFMDGSYFCFISLSTIGFGDIVPTTNKKESDNSLELNFIFCSIYLMLGMALIAMCFNLMQQDVVQKIRTCTDIIRRIARCRRWYTSRRSRTWRSNSRVWIMR